MSNRAGFGLVGLLLAAFAGLACDELPTANSRTGTPAPDSPAAAEVVAEINAVRAARGLSELAVDPRLSEAATSYSCRMAREGFFDHVDPQGNAIDARMEAAGIDYLQVGENLARNENADDPVDTAVEGWLASEGHLANIVRPEVTLTGVGVCQDGVSYYFTQLFLLPP